MDIERIFAGVMFILAGFYGIMARKRNTYDALMRNIFKPNFDEKRLKIFEIMSAVFGLVFIIFGIIIILYG